MKILIDPGHGGNDPGAVARNGQTEARTNLNVSYALRTELLDQGHTVIMTRTAHEQAVSIEARQELIKRHRPALVISVHHNGSTNQSVTGSEVLAQIPGKACADVSYKLAQAINAEFRALGRHIRGIIRKPNSAGTADYYGLLRTAADCGIPAVITEYAFMTSADVGSIDTREEQARQAQAIARAVWFIFASKEDKEMQAKLEAMEKTVANLSKQVEALKPKTYDAVADVPEWARPTVSKLVQQGLLQGSGGRLGLTYDMLRTMVILDRAGAFK